MKRTLFIFFLIFTILLLGVTAFLIIKGNQYAARQLEPAPAEQSTPATEPTEKPAPLFVVQNATEDLNGDGTIDEIRFEAIIDQTTVINPFTLVVNNVELKAEAEALEANCGIIDLDSKDKFKELLVSELGPSDDPQTYFFYYDGTKILAMGAVPGLFKEIKFRGNGDFTTTSRGKVLQTWYHPEDYRVTPTRGLQVLPRNYYVMNTRVKMKRSLPLQKSPTETALVTTLKPGETVVILGSDDRQWCLVRNSRGIKGWFKVTDFDLIKRLNLRAGEVFDGLSNAD